MPSKKKKYNARFPAGRIKKIMQTDEEVGKVAQAVPVIISRTLELFVESLLIKSMSITQSRNAKTLTPSHMKQCILSENRFDFLKDLVSNIPDASIQEDNENNAIEAIHSNIKDEVVVDMKQEDEPMIVANFYTEQGTSAGRTPVIQYSPKITIPDPVNPVSLTNPTIDVKIAQIDNTPPVVPSLVPTIFSIDNLVRKEPKIHIDLSNMNPMSIHNPLPVSSLISTPVSPSPVNHHNLKPTPIPASQSDIPPLVPINHHYYGQTTSDNLYIDEDYDN